MGWVVRLLRAEPQARRFFLAYGQSALGTGVAYVALLLIAYQRFHSPWAIALVLLADYVPPMLLSPLFGAAADRWSRRNCAVIADTARAVAYIGIAASEKDFDLLQIYPGLPKMSPISPLQPSPGYNAISPTYAIAFQYGLYHKHPDIRPWYDQVPPQEKIGTLLLYYFAPR